MDQFTLPYDVSLCCDTLRQAGHPAHPVGGCVRDLLLGRIPGDWDLCTSALPEQTASLFPNVALTGAKHGTITVLTGTGPIEVTTFRADGPYSDGRRPDTVMFCRSLEQDLARRDFTVNAMALDEDGHVVDLFGGQADLNAQILRCIGDPNRRFEEDGLRMFRAIRFQAQLGFQLTEDTIAAIRRQAHKAVSLSRERVRTEVEKALLSPQPAKAALFFHLGLMTSCAQGQPAPLDCLAALPPETYVRWAGLCGALLERGAIPTCAQFLTALRLDGGTRRACAAGEVLWREGLPNTTHQWRHTLARFGRAACRAAAAMAGPAPLEELDALLSQAPCITVGQLALSGGELASFGLAGRDIGRAQAKLLAHVLDFPQDNTRERLLQVLATGQESQNGSKSLPSALHEDHHPLVQPSRRPGKGPHN